MPDGNGASSRPKRFGAVLEPDLGALINATDAELQATIRANPAWFQEMSALLLETQEVDQQTCALSYYTPMNPMAEPVHYSIAKERVVAGGNRSAKTETALVELMIAATGHIPMALEKQYPREKLNPPGRFRVACRSLTSTLEMVIKPKLRYDVWSGEGNPGSGRGHWGWIPKRCLVGGSWEKAYSEKYRTLKVRVDTDWVGSDGFKWSKGGISTIQFLGYDNEPSEYSGASLHGILHDELPPSDIYRENKMRVLDTNGWILTAFTPPDEPGAQAGDVAWFYDTVYLPGIAGVGKDPRIDSFTLWTEKNRVLDPTTVETIARGLTEEQRQARLYGAFLHLSGVVYPLFAQHPTWWCFKCHRKAISQQCVHCGGDDTETFCHVTEAYEWPKTWPIIFVIDPHPRKADACGWFALTPSDGVVMIGEMDAEGDASDVVGQITEWEREHHVAPVRRLMDPNMATQTNDRLERGWNMRMAYDRVGLRCDMANDSIPVGIQNVNELLKPDPFTREPRFSTLPQNRKFIHGMTHWSWGEWARAGEREPKESVRDRFKDYPDLLRYAANDLPTYRGLVRSQMGTKRLPPERGY